MGSAHPEAAVQDAAVRGIKHTAAGTDLHVGQRPGGHRGAGLLVGDAPRILLAGTAAHQGDDRLTEVCSDPFVVCSAVGHERYVCGLGGVRPCGHRHRDAGSTA